MSLKGAEASTVENVGASQKQGFGRKMITHFKKWWWVHLIITCLTTLVVTLILVYVAFPKIAQSNVNDATLAVKSQVITNPTPNSVDLKIDSISDSDSIYHPLLDAFRGDFYLTKDGETNPDNLGKSFGHVTIPSSTAGQDVPVTIEQTMQIADMDAFTEYNIAVLKSKEFQVLLSGDVTLHEMVLPASTCDYDKVITLKGLDGLSSLEITKMRQKGLNGIEGEVYVNNPSVLTIEMGTVYTDLYVEDTQIGTNILHDVTLKPGDNTLKMTGTTDVSKLFKFTGKNGYPLSNFPLSIHGNRSEFNGVEIPYYSKALQSNVLEVKVNLVKLLTG